MEGTAFETPMRVEAARREFYNDVYGLAWDPVLALANAIEITSPDQVADAVQDLRKKLVASCWDDLLSLEEYPRARSRLSLFALTGW